jgi:hypothetical protein
MLWQIFWIQITAYYSLHICIKIVISTEDMFLGFSSKNTHMTLCNMINAERYSGSIPWDQIMKRSQNLQRLVSILELANQSP